MIDLTAKAKEQLGANTDPAKTDFSRFVIEWAKANGLTATQSETEIKRWISAVEQKGDDPYKLGLTAFYRKDFSKAAEHFNQAALARSNQVNTLKDKNQLTPEANARLVREGTLCLLLAARSCLFNNDFVNAGNFFQNAANYTSREESPETWAGTLLELGQVYSELGLRTSGDESEKLFVNAAEAIRLALEVFTREGFSQKWAESQSSLGATLASQGIRTEGDAGDKLLFDGAEALRKSLEVVTRVQAPLPWAKTQNNLGAALAEQGMRSSGEAGLRQLLDAIAAYRSALEVRTYETYPQEWASTQNNLAAVYYFMKDWPKVAECYSNVLKVFPKNALAYRTASELHQKALFDFDLAFKLNQEWVKNNPNDLLEQVKLVEKYFTTGRFQECQSQVAVFVDNKDYSPLVHAVMRAIEIANLIALKSPAVVPAKLDALLQLLKEQPDHFKVEFNTAGMQYYVNQNALFANYGDWLVKFLQAMEGDKRDTVFIALESAKASFPTISTN
ncbi:MAG TPA: hypothetical protein VGA99_03115 [bacterium]